MIAGLPLACAAPSSSTVSVASDVHNADGEKVEMLQPNAEEVDSAPAQDIISPPQVTALWLGIEGLPQNLLGKAGNGKLLRWAVPRQGFDLNLNAEAVTAPQELPVLTAVHGLDSLPVPVLPTLLWEAEGKGWWRMTVPVADAGLALGGWVFSAQLANAGPLQLANIEVQLADRTPQIDPFDHDDPWLLLFSRDAAGIQVVQLGDTFTVTTQEKPNGMADFDESLAAFGLQGGDALWNAKLRTLFKERLRQWLRTLFRHNPLTGELSPKSIRVRLLFDGDADIANYDPATLSKMAIGGLSPEMPEKKQLFGLATIDLWNNNPNDDSKPGLGVFTFSLVKAALGQPLAINLLRSVLPVASGSPFGSQAGDEKLLDPNLTADQLPEGPLRERGQLFLTELGLLSLGIASITAHEIGHSVGMIHPGLPPHGLLGGVPGPWVGIVQDQYHIDTTGPNLMQTGDSFNPLELLTSTPTFSALEAGYLRGRLLILKP